MEPIQIGKNLVGGDNPIYLLAEIGINHNGDLETAKNMIIAAAISGANGVKFQTFKADKLTSESADPEEVDYFRKYELSYDDFVNLKKIADKYEVDFISTPFDLESLAFLVELGVPAIKISSGDLTYYPLIEAARDTGLPIIISTGMATIKEIYEMFVNCIHVTDNVTLLHCVSLYPTEPEEANLKAIQTLQATFPDIHIGYSDHTIGIDACIMAAGMGACFLEKHFTLDHDLPGTDHKLAATPNEFTQLFKCVYHFNTLRGDGIKLPQPREIGMRDTMRRNPVDWLRPYKRKANE